MTTITDPTEECIRWALMVEMPTLPNFERWADRWLNGQDRSVTSAMDIYRQLSDVMVSLEIIKSAVSRAARGAVTQQRT